MSIALTHERALQKRSEASDPPIDLLLAALQLRQGNRTFVDFADDIGLYEGTLRSYMKGTSDAGLDTLCALIDWDPTLEPLILDRMRERGKMVRQREHFQRDRGRQRQAA